MSSLLGAAALFLLIGCVLGLLGGGGGILAVPVLVYALNVAPKPAIAMSLLLVGVTSLVGAALQARARLVHWKLGALFASFSMTGAFAGGRLAALVPERVLLGGLGSVMLLTAFAMLKRRLPRRVVRAVPLPRVLLMAAGVGVVSGLVGAGGGFLIVPVLTLFGGLTMREAIGTSLFVSTLQALAGFAGHVSHVELDWQLAMSLTGAEVVGILFGTALGRRVSGGALRRAFAGLVMATGLFVLGRQLPLYWLVLIATAAFLVVCILIRTPPSPRRRQRAFQRQSRTSGMSSP